MCGVVQGLLIHVMGTRLYDAQLSSLQRKEVTIRPVRQMLEKLHGLDERPLTVVRPLNHFYGIHTFYPTFASGKGGAPFNTVQEPPLFVETWIETVPRTPVTVLS